jgi:hypothetical protein
MTSGKIDVVLRSTWRAVDAWARRSLCGRRPALAPAVEIDPPPRDGAWPQFYRMGKLSVGHQTIDGRSSQTRHSEHHGHAQEQGL